MTTGIFSHRQVASCAGGSSLKQLTECIDILTAGTDGDDDCSRDESRDQCSAAEGLLFCDSRLRNDDAYQWR